MFPNGNGQESFKTNRELISDMHEIMQRLDKNSDRINRVLFGDKDADQKGLVEKVADHGKYISVDRKLKIFGTGLAASTGTGWAFWDQIKHILFK